MNNLVNSIEFEYFNYLTASNTEEEAVQSMYEDLSKQIQFLLKNHYTIKVSGEERRIRLEYNYSAEFMEDKTILNPYWVSEDEYNSIIESTDEFYRKLP